MDRDAFAKRVQQEAGGQWDGVIIHGGKALVALVAKNGLMTANDTPGETKSFKKGEMKDVKTPSGVMSFSANGYRVTAVDSKKGVFVINDDVGHTHGSPYTQSCPPPAKRLRSEDFPWPG